MLDLTGCHLTAFVSPNGARSMFRAAFLVRNSRKIYNVKHIRNYLEMNDFPQRPGLIGWFQVKLENCLSVFSRVQTLNGSGLGQNQPGEFW